MPMSLGYGQFMKSIKEKSIVTFSGGEPGLHPMLDIILTNAKYYCHTVKVVTNGLAFSEAYLPYVDMWHIGVTKKEPSISAIKTLTDKVMVQIVVTSKMDLERLTDMVAYYRSYDIPVKLFTDFFDPRNRKIRNMILDIQDHFGDGIYTRFTGKQVNRGSACSGCEEDCVTLKALWYFPDGSSSTCPQGNIILFSDDSWDETVEKAYEAHKI